MLYLERVEKEGGKVMNYTTQMKGNSRKLTVAAMIVALTVSLSSFFIPIGMAKCYPIQHVMNIIAGVFLGPAYAVATAFVSSFIRNVLGTGSLLAFPGSMVGALLAALCYKKMKKLYVAYLGEVIGTGGIGALLCYPIATLLMGKEAALFTYVMPFFMSTVTGMLIAVVLLQTLKQAKVLLKLQEMMKGE